MNERGLPIRLLTYSQKPTRRLLQAVQRNDLATARAAIDAGADVHQRYDASMTTTGRTVLMAAVHSGDDAMMAFLLGQGLDPNAPADDGSTATSQAWFNRPERFALLHARGGDLGLAHRQTGRGVLLQTLEYLDQIQQNDPVEFMAAGGAFETGGDLPRLTAMGLNWLQPQADGLTPGLTPHQALVDWFPPAFVRRIMACRAQHEQAVLNDELTKHGLDQPDLAHERPRL